MKVCSLMIPKHCNTTKWAMLKNKSHVFPFCESMIAYKLYSQPLHIYYCNQIQTVQRAQGDENKVSGYGYSFCCGFKWGPHHATSHLRSRLESQHQSIPGCAEECGDPLVQSSGRPISQKRSRLGFRRSATTLYPSLTVPLLPRPEPAGLLSLIIRGEHHKHDLPQHQSQPDRRHPPSIRRAPAGACGKSMLRVPDPYWGGDWGWRRLHWIDVSSTT